MDGNETVLSSSTAAWQASRNSRPSIAFQVVRIVVLAALAAMFVHIFTQEAAGNFPSDIPAHIRTALSDEEAGYSLVYPFIAFSYTYAGPFGVGVFLAVLEVATLVVSELLMRRLLPDVREEAVFAMALIANFLMAIFLPVLHPHFSHGLSVGNAWHNSTYLAMKLLALGAVWGYLRYVGALESKNRVLDWVVLSVCIVASAAVKPSFITVFGPAVVAMCVIDLLHDRSTLKRSLLLSIPFFIVVGIMLYQYTLLYVEDTSSGIGFGIARVWRHTHFFFPLGMLQSYAFPFAVFIFCYKQFKEDVNYRLTLIMFGVGLLIYLFVNETGSRTGHGNFAWGLKFAVYYLFITSIVVYVRAYGQKFPFLLKCTRRSLVGAVNGVGGSDEPDDSGARGESASGEASSSPVPASNPRPAFWPELFMLLVLACHFASGIGAIVKILTGHGYG